MAEMFVIPAPAGIQGAAQRAARSRAVCGGASGPLSLQGERARVRVLRGGADGLRMGLIAQTEAPRG